MRVLRRAIAEAGSLQEVSRLEDALQRGVLPDDLLHKATPSPAGAGAAGAMMKAAPPSQGSQECSRHAFPPQPVIAPCAFAPDVPQLPASPPGHEVSHALLCCQPAEIRARSLQAIGGVFPPQLPQEAVLGHCAAARGQGWPDVGAVGGEERLAMPDISALHLLSRALVAKAKAPTSAAGLDPFSQFLAEVGAEGGATLRSHPPDVVASAISAGSLFAAEKQGALVARLRRAGGETGAVVGAAEGAAAAFCERNWVNREAEARLLRASAAAQRAVVAEGPLLGANPSGQLAGRLLRVEAMTGTSA